MRFALLLSFLLWSTLAPTLANAQQAEARAVAVRNGCKPTKIEVSSQTVGSSATIAYLVTCAPAAGASAGQPSLRILCRNRLCTTK